MKALVVRQPWANLIASGRKTIEVRTWKTSYRGPLLIVSGKELDYAGINRLLDLWITTEGTTGGTSPRGVAICTAELCCVLPMCEADERKAMVKARPGLEAWRLKNIRRVEPFPVRGMPGLFDVEIPR